MQIEVKICELTEAFIKKRDSEISLTDYSIPTVS
jgi:hypothetical protein